MTTPPNPIADFLAGYEHQDHAPEFPHEQEHQDHADDLDAADDRDDDHREVAEEMARLAAEAGSPEEMTALAQCATAHATLHLGDMLAAFFVALHAPGLDAALGRLFGMLMTEDIPDGPDLSPILACGATLGSLDCLMPVHGEDQPHVFGDSFPGDGPAR